MKRGRNGAILRPCPLTLTGALFALLAANPRVAAAQGTTPNPKGTTAAPTGTNPLTPTTPAPDLDTTTYPVIKKVVVEGNKVLNSPFIISQSGVKIGEQFTPALQEEMISNLTSTNLFGSFSNQSPPVSVIDEEPTPANGTCTVVIQVEENPVVTNITLTGTGPIKPQIVMGYLKNLTGVFNYGTFVSDTNAITALYTSEGYQMQVSPDVSMGANGVLDLPLIVAKVAQIHIVGLHKTHPFVVTREMNTKVGSYYNTKTLDADLRALYNLRIFKNITITPETVAPGQYSITLHITETHTGSIIGGVGYSQTEGVIGYVQASDDDFEGDADTLSIRGSTGGVLGRNSVNLGFTDPYLDSHHTALGVQLYDETIYPFSSGFSAFGSNNLGGSSYYNQQRVGGTITLGRPINLNYSASVFLRAENVQTDLLDLPLQDLQIIQDGPIFAAGATLHHDTRDYALNPSKGGYEELSVEGGVATLTSPISLAGISVPGVFGTAHFLKGSISASRYFSLTGQRPLNNPTKDETILALRLTAGTSIGTLPFAEQFFVGGADTLRGYLDSRFWGKNELLASVELRQPIAPNFTGVLFVDSGDAWGGPYSTVNLTNYLQSGFRMHVAVGVGALVRTPLGDLRIDYGIGDQGGRADFSIGQAF